MKTLAVLISFLAIGHSFAQKNTIDKKLRVIETKDYANGYVITGVGSLGVDTMHFISLKDSIKSSCSHFEKIRIGYEYLFKITDIDYIKGYYAPVNPDGYRIKFGNVYIRREGRNGQSITTTQYLSSNTKGLFLELNKK